MLSYRSTSIGFATLSLLFQTALSTAQSRATAQPPWLTTNPAGANASTSTTPAAPNALPPAPESHPTTSSPSPPANATAQTTSTSAPASPPSASSGDASPSSTEPRVRSTSPNARPIRGREPWARSPDDIPEPHVPVVPPATSSAPTSPAEQLPNVVREAPPVFDLRASVNFSAPWIGPTWFYGTGSASNIFADQGQRLGYDRPIIFSGELQAGYFPVSWFGFQALGSLGYVRPDIAPIAPAATSYTGGFALVLAAAPSVQYATERIIVRLSLFTGARMSDFELSNYPPTPERRCEMGMCYTVNRLPRAVAWQFMMQPRLSVDATLTHDRFSRLSVGGYIGLEVVPGASFTFGVSLSVQLGRHLPENLPARSSYSSAATNVRAQSRNEKASRSSSGNTT